jgi:hypothetical protein
MDESQTGMSDVSAASSVEEGVSSGIFLFVII